MKPNLFLIGAMKSGTSSLHDYLNEHPDIFMSTPKEPSHFSRESSYRNGDQQYLNLFQDATNALIVGESSTQYAKAPTIQGVPERIYKFNPEARILYIMRDPIERAVSHYWFNWMNHGESRDMLTAFRENPDYINFSNYPMQLSLYAGVFDWSRIKTTTTEELEIQPIQVMQDLFTWLGIDNSFVPSNLASRSNVRPPVPFRARQNADFIGNLRNFYLYRRLRPLLPKQLNFTLRTLVEERPEGVDGESVELAKSYVRPILKDKVSILEKLLGATFPMWTELYE